MKLKTRVVWGVVFVILAILTALNSFGIISFELFFDGWWTLFIIVPCAVGLFNEEDKTRPLIGLLIGIVLLLYSNNIFPYYIARKALIPLILLILGIRLIMGNNNKDFVVERSDSDEENKVYEAGIFSEKPVRTVWSVFAGKDVRCTNVTFDILKLNSVIGTINCDLRNAQIDKDIIIIANSVLGNVNVYLPENVETKTNISSFLGSVNAPANQYEQHDNVVVIINGNCVMGGVEIH